MATTKEYKNYIVDTLSYLGDIRVRPMMGEYLFYYKNKYVAMICENQFLIKKTEKNRKYNMVEKFLMKEQSPCF